MAINKTQKEEILAKLIVRVKDAQSIGFATTTTVNVEEFYELRKNLREVWASYSIAKKTLIRKAVKEALWIDLDLSTLPGQIWMVCSNEDAIAGLWKTNDFIKANADKMTWAASIFEWEVKNLDDTKVIASMPSRDTLLWRLVWSMQSPLSSLARFLDAASKELEAKWKEKVKDLIVEAKEEVKEEPKAEAKVEEVKEEVKTEEAKSEVEAK